MCRIHATGLHESWESLYLIGTAWCGRGNPRFMARNVTSFWWALGGQQLIQSLRAIVCTTFYDILYQILCREDRHGNLWRISCFTLSLYSKTNYLSIRFRKRDMPLSLFSGTVPPPPSDSFSGTLLALSPFWLVTCRTYSSFISFSLLNKSYNGSSGNAPIYLIPHEHGFFHLRVLCLVKYCKPWQRRSLSSPCGSRTQRQNPSRRMGSALWGCNPLCPRTRPAPSQAHSLLTGLPRGCQRMVVLGPAGECWWRRLLWANSDLLSRPQLSPSQVPTIWLLPGWLRATFDLAIPMASTVCLCDGRFPRLSRIY